MTITSERLEELMTQELLGTYPDPNDQEEVEFLQNVRKDIAKAKKNNWVVDIPPEIQVQTDSK
jgi:hypothetical protein